jgi:hypothetical protein
MAAAAVAAVRMNRQYAGPRFNSVGRFDLDRQAIFMAGPVDPDVVADEDRCQQRHRPEPSEIHARLAGPAISASPRLAQGVRHRQTGAPTPLDPGRVLAKDLSGQFRKKETA